MPLGKFVAIAGVVVFAPLAFAFVVANLRAEPAATMPRSQPAAVPLSGRTATPTDEAAPQKPDEVKTASTTPEPAEPKAFFQPAAEEKPRPATPKAAPVSERGSGGDMNCPDFGSHEEAQRFFIANGGPADDPHGLDRDHDGLACESN